MEAPSALEFPSPFRAGSLPTLIGYTALVVAALAGFFGILSLGASLHAPAPAVLEPGAPRPGTRIDLLPQVLLTLLVVMLCARGLGALFRAFRQPPVIGEVVAGILLGPSFLGWLAPEVAARVLPPTVAPTIGILAQVGVILFMFLVGLELDPGRLRDQAHATVAISHASIIVPFLLGSGLAVWIYPHLSTSDVTFTRFALFLGVSMSVTAFPVLARILTDRGIQRTKLGVVALTCAAVDDVTAWCLLAFVVSIAQAHVEAAAWTTGLTLAYIAVMFVAARPLAHRLARRLEGRTVPQGAVALLFMALLASALLTESIGIHAVFGAFMLGAVIPHDSALARATTEKLEDVVVVLLLPAFFAFTGMRTRIGLVRGAEQWIFCGVILLVACVGKFGGTAVAARLTGLGWRDSAALGVLMNTRGLMELVVLNIGLELGVISPTLFAMMVLMAVITTFATTPILHLLTRGRAEYAGAAAVARGLAAQP